MQFAGLKSKALGLGLAAAFVVGACSAGTQAGAGTGGDLTLRIVSPADGAEVSIPFEVRLESNVPLGPPESGNHHAHLYFDTGTDSSDYDLVYGNSVQVSRPLSPGTHTIIASLRNPDHGDAGPSQRITVTVTGAGGSAPSPAPTTDPYSY